MTLQTQPNPTHNLCSQSWPNPTQPNIEQQHNVVQIGYINHKPISRTQRLTVIVGIIHDVNCDDKSQ